jgi:integrase
MGRTPLTPGSWGAIRVRSVSRADGSPLRWKAYAQYRDLDGLVRQVEAVGTSKDEATANLTRRLQHRHRGSIDSRLTAATRFAEAAELWRIQLVQLKANGVRKGSTVDVYRAKLNLVLPALRGYRLGELTAPILNVVLTGIAAEHGVQTARGCRTVINNVLQYAVSRGAIPFNPGRHLAKIEGAPRRRGRQLTEHERAELHCRFVRSEKARRWMLPQLMIFMLGTRARIGEALALVWSDIDLTQGTVTMAHTLEPVEGEGLVRVDTKTPAGRRTLSLPEMVWAMLAAIHEHVRPAPGDPVFPSAQGGFRYPTNVRRVFREVRGDDVLASVRSHDFRVTAATMLHDAGIPPGPSPTSSGTAGSRSLRTTTSAAPKHRARAPPEP